MATDSGLPLAKKLDLRPGLRTYFVKLPPDVDSVLHRTLAECVRVRGAHKTVDFVMVFSSTASSLVRELDRATGRLASDGLIWAAWPKKSSGRVSALNDRKVREIGVSAGLVDVKVCSVSDTWSGLKFVRRLKDRNSSQAAHRTRRPSGERA